MPESPADITDEMVEAAADVIGQLGDGIADDYVARHVLTAARSRDPLVAEVERLREALKGMLAAYSPGPHEHERWRLYPCPKCAYDRAALYAQEGEE